MWRTTKPGQNWFERPSRACLCDVFVLEGYRNQGVGKWLIGCVMDHPALKGLRRMLLGTKDAHSLYERFGFTPLTDPSR